MNIVTSKKHELVESCSRLCINPSSIKMDALKLMAYSNSRDSLKNRAEYCPTTQDFEENLFSEILNLFVSLALRSRLWKENYSRGERQAEINNISVGVCRIGLPKKIGKLVKISEVLSYVSHAEAFWFDPCKLLDFPTGTNISIRVPPDPNRSSNYLRTISKIETTLSTVESLEQEEVDACNSTLQKLRKMDDSAQEEDRIFTINIDQFSCAVGSIIDECHECAGYKGHLHLSAESDLPY